MQQPKKTLPIDVSDDLDQQIELFASKTGRSRARIVNDAVETYIQDQLRWLGDMDTAMADIDKGQTHDGREVLTWIESWGDTPERPGPSGK